MGTPARRLSVAGSERIVFANQLRGVAAFSVAYSHLVGLFWAVPDLVSAVTGSRSPGPPPESYLPYIYFNGVTPGPFGVGLFFLISGFVIPLSLARQTRLGFLLARLVRIYPVYLVAMALQVVVTQASAAWWGRPLPINLQALLANALLVENYTGQPNFDLVNWTLAIEVKFYLLAALLAGPIRRGTVWPLFAAGLVLTAANAAAAAYWPPGGTPVIIFGNETAYIVFMLIGVLFSFHLRGLIDARQLMLYAAAMLGLYLVCWYAGAAAAVYAFQYNARNYLYAFVMFGFLYRFRHRIRPFAPLDFLAAISYPFYLIHVLVGLSALRLFTAGCGIGFLPALALATLAVLGLATALHFTLERRAIAAGRALANAVGRWQAKRMGAMPPF